MVRTAAAHRATDVALGQHEHQKKKKKRFPAGANVLTRAYLDAFRGLHTPLYLQHFCTAVVACVHATVYPRAFGLFFMRLSPLTARAFATSGGVLLCWRPSLSFLVLSFCSPRSLFYLALLTYLFNLVAVGFIVQCCGGSSW